MSRKRPTAPVKKLGVVLATLYPTVFDKAAPLPLAVDAHLEIRRDFPKASRKVIRRFMRVWCLRGAYLRAVLAPGAVRHHIDGRPARRVDAVGRANARKLLKIKSPRWKNLPTIPQPKGIEK